MQFACVVEPTFVLAERRDKQGGSRGRSHGYEEAAEYAGRARVLPMAAMVQALDAVLDGDTNAMVSAATRASAAEQGRGTGSSDVLHGRVLFPCYKHVGVQGLPLLATRVASRQELLLQRMRVPRHQWQSMLNRTPPTPPQVGDILVGYHTRAAPRRKSGGRVTCEYVYNKWCDNAWPSLVCAALLSAVHDGTCTLAQWRRGMERLRQEDECPGRDDLLLLAGVLSIGPAALEALFHTTPGALQPLPDHAPGTTDATAATDTDTDTAVAAMMHTWHTLLEQGPLQTSRPAADILQDFALQAQDVSLGLHLGKALLPPLPPPGGHAPARVAGPGLGGAAFSTAAMPSDRNTYSPSRPGLDDGAPFPPSMPSLAIPAQRSATPPLAAPGTGNPPPSPPYRPMPTAAPLLQRVSRQFAAQCQGQAAVSGPATPPPYDDAGPSLWE